MHCLGASWALDLGTHSPHYLLYMIASLHFHLTSLVVLFVSSCLSYLLLIHIIFFHPEWWSSSVHYMEGRHVISTIYPMDTDTGILSLRRSPRQRGCVIYWYLRACLFIFDPVFGSSLYAFRACIVHSYVVKKKALCIVIYHWVCMDIRGSLDQACLLTEVRMWASRDPSSFVFILSYILWVRWVTFS